MWTSLQGDALESQKMTCPGETVCEPVVTVAVNVTTVPLATVVTLLLPDVTAREMAVAVFVCPAALDHAPHRIAARIHSADRSLAPVWRRLHDVETT